MKQHVAGLALFLCSGVAFAGTGLNCNDIDNMNPNEMDACAEQTDQELNASYKTAMAAMKKQDNGSDKLLKDAQRAWLKMRAAQCEMASLNTGGSAANAMVSCEVGLTMQRTDYLDGLTE